MSDPLTQELDGILSTETLTPLFQPIVAADDQSIYGYEALIRGPSDSPLHSPLTLFDTAHRAGRLVELDLLCRRLSIEAFSTLALSGHLFLNVMPTSLLEDDFREGLTSRFLAGVELSPKRVVIELTEYMPIHDYALMRQAVAHYREMGFRVALDDLGAGYSSLRHWTELRPDFVKVDRHFVQELDRDPGKRQFLGHLLDVSQSLGCQLIAEGIETAGEQHSLQDLNCRLLQGYHFARPSQEPPRHLHTSPPGTTPLRSSTGALGTNAAMLCRHLDPVLTGTLVPDVLQRFKHEPGLRCLVVLDRQQIPLGLVHQQDLLGQFANPFSHALYARRPIDELMNTRMLVADAALPLDILSERITGAPESLQEDFVIVDDTGRYRGMGNIIDLLREITALQVRSARQANPLTGLPGNLVINQTIAARLEKSEAFIAVYCDLDNFKAYNDVYGYAQGDQVILAVARLLQERCREEDFVGHVGGDDFMLILGGDLTAAQHLCETILDRFARFVPRFYHDEHRQAGGLNVTSRRGENVFFPLMSLSMALHPVGTDTEFNALDIANVLAELKHQAKQKPGNSLFVDRRHHDHTARLAERDVEPMIARAARR
ncbi:bifunctional diguanylate cyclase/phosphodiesterase [Aidingimonas lacisalsi]|uniref:bifunctional diguanylate cyclase/phosphodiesterase n=1 Tax=Aidingimonas lacisalsi TaxID=2604086 RepID=UPI0011D2C4A7|nr:bifunctional diguanylate cyclase/phosphodiesterase [Aidingimonas lacisalsi]